MWRVLVVCVVCGVVGLAGWSAAARAEEVSLVAGSGSSVFASPTVVAGSPEEAQELASEHESMLDSPEAVAVREASRTRFEALDPEQAGKLDGEEFPQVVSVPGGPSRLPVGERIVTYASSTAARLELSGGGGGVLESLSPIAIETSPGRRVPIDLSLSEAGGQFQPARGLVGVRIPTSLSDGVSLLERGVSLTPVNVQGQSLAGSGSIIGASVVYANTLTDTDTLVKPTTDGFDLDAMLHSVRSPEQLYFRVGMPAGAELVGDGQGGARVVVEGQTIVSILPPAAQDAAGSPVPVSISVSGDLLILNVDHLSGSYQYPVEVDPSIIDSQLVKVGAKRANWEFSSEGSKFGDTYAVCKGPGEQYLETCATGEYKVGEFAQWKYQTRGNSKIFEFKGETEAENTSAKIESRIELQDNGTTEEFERLSTELKEPKYARRALPEPLCPKGKTTCTSSYGGEGNAVHFQQSVAGAGNKFFDYLYAGEVSITEPEEHATTKFNTGSAELEGEVVNTKGEKEKIRRKNVMDGGGWLSEYDGALELISEDKGIGVSNTQLEWETTPGKWEQIAKHNYLTEEDLCKGYQCEPKDEEFWVLSPRLPNGEDKIRYRAEDGMGSSTESTESEGVTTVKVDTAKPRALRIHGLPWGNELSERPYGLTVEATDGEGTTVASSGIESVALYIDGGLIGTNGGTGGKEGTEGKCSQPAGECTASAKWTLDGAQLGAGKHQIEVVARDRAGNEQLLYDPISIRHSTPVSLGPGSVDLESGDYAFSTTDVSMGSGLTLSRSYSSRDLTQGYSGPFGPEWGMSMSSTESLTELVDGSVMMTAANGKQTIFASLGSGKFESPTGDSNLELTLEENKETKQKLAYHLKNSAADTSVKFTQPSGSLSWVPTIQEGVAPSDTVTFAYQTGPTYENSLASGSGPASIAAANGATWVALAGTNKILKLYPGNHRVEYELPTGSDPNSVATGPNGNIWFTDWGTDKIGEITPSGSISERSVSGNNGISNIIPGPEGDMWFLTRTETITETKTEFSFKLGKASTSGITEYATTVFGESPIAGPDGNIWVALGSAIYKITPTGTASEVYKVPSGEVRYLVSGPDGNIWFTNQTTNKIGKMTTAGHVIAEYSLPAKSSPLAIIAGPDGNLWFDNYETSKIGKITTEGTITEYSIGGEVGHIWPNIVGVGPENNIWYGASSLESMVGMIPLTGPQVEPTEVLAPPPAKVSCTPMKTGCRALKFQYASKTTARGELLGEWGEYEGRLNKVLFDAYNPTSKEMQETAVAQYSYDGLGRLRAEWDPRISPALKTVYGYDEEGHITALEPAGQEPWLFTYGQTATDPGTGRLIKVMRPTAATQLWEEPVKNTEIPKIVGSMYEGTRLAASNGKWSGRPLSYSYQWERCSVGGKQCTVIPGATNANYTLKSSDVESTFRVAVSATNSLGSATALSSVSAVVLPIEFSLPSGSGPIGITEGPEGYTWFTAGSSGNVGDLLANFYLFEHSGDKDEPQGIVTGPDGNLWFVEQAVGHINHMTPSGALTTFSLTRSNPGNTGIAVGPEKILWFTESHANYVGRINTSDEVLGEYALPAGSTPKNIVEGSNENLWFTDYGTNKIGEITKTGTIVAEFKLPSGSEPYGITAGPDKNLWYTDYGTNKIGKITTAGTITEYSLPAGSEPRSIVAGPDSNLWFTEFGTSKIGKITTSGTVTQYPQPAGSQPAGITVSEKDIWYTDYGTNKIARIIIGATEGENQSPQPGYTIEYNVPLEGSNAPAQMGINPTTKTSETAQWGQTEDIPVEATSIFPPDSPQGWPASSYTRATTYYLDEDGRVVNAAQPSNGKYGAISTTEYNEENDITRTLTPDNRATALEAGEKSVEVATLLSTFNTYKNKCSRESEFNEERESDEFGTRLCETEGPEHIVKYTGTKGQEEGEARDHVRYFYDEKIPAEGPNKESFSKETFNLVTETQNLTEILGSKGKVEEEIEPRTTITSYSGQNNLGWKLRAPTSVTTDAQLGGKKLKTTTLYNENGQVIETRTPEGEAGNSARDVKIVYYTSENEAETAECRKHPEWAGLVCETLPAKQPETSGIPNLPVTETTYNMWNEAEKVKETFTFTPHPTTIRTKKDEYDPAGRLISSETTVTGSENKTLPKVAYEYETSQGALSKESDTSGGKTETISNKFNTLGQLTEYTDASTENTMKYVYGGPEKDFQVEEVSDSSNAGKSRQTYTYNLTTMQLETLWDSAAETFTASYDTEGRLTSEIYPNGMCANYTYNSVGKATHLEYIKTTSCGEKTAPVWYSESIGSTIRGETLNRTSSLATENYSYDTLGRLIETQETPAGGECSVRAYEYDTESDRTKLTSRKPISKTECPATGGTEEKHTYDEAGRIADTGIEYESLGNITNLPAADAEGHAIKSTFYTDGAVASQSQNSVTNEYGLDPAGRVFTITTGGKTTINHYDGIGETVAWSCEAGIGTETCEAGKWTRNIPGIDGDLAAVQANGATPVLQLHDLKGNVIATAELNPGATKLLSTYNSTEFGVPNNEKIPPSFAWLGAAGVSRSLSSGVITYGTTSYVPQTARTLQTLAVESPGDLAPIGGGTYATFTAEPWNMQGGARVEAEAPGIAAAEQREAEEAACRAAPESCSEDPSWSGDIRIADARKISEDIETLEGLYYLGGGKFAEKVVEFLAEDLKINFITQLKEILQKGLFGYSLDQVAQWAFAIGNLLGSCVETTKRYKDPHCWLYIPTVVRHLYKGSPGWEIPNFAASVGWNNPNDVAVGFCPFGVYSRCYNQNETD